MSELTERDRIEHAIQKLQRALTQTEPDGRNCAVCGDNDHQAFECRHNPLVEARKWRAFEKRAHELHEALHRELGL